MYSLTIHFGPNAVAWTFLFKERTSIDKTLTITAVPELLIIDDYGQEARIVKEQIHGILIENSELGLEARIIRSLDQALGNARTQKRAASNPELQALMQRQGPGVLTPFSNGGFR